MPRYVLVEFDDNAAAKKFVERVNGRYGMPTEQRSFRVRAVWALPTKFCECTRSSGKMWAMTRGLKSGWWLHSDCGRPGRRWAAGDHWWDSLGRNLLPGNTDYIPRGWGLPNVVKDDGTNGTAHIDPTWTGEPPDEKAWLKNQKKKARQQKKRKMNPRRV